VETSKSKSLTLRVAEAKAKDVGRGIARIDPGDLAKVDAEIGDVIQIEGSQKTVAKVMPAYPEERGKSLIQVDGITRNNAQVSLGEKVTVQKGSCSPADKIVLSPLSPAPSFTREGDAKYISTLFDGLALVEGDTIRANLFGTRSQDFIVISTVPKGPVLVHSRTKIEARGKNKVKARELKVSYEDIGGLGKELQRIREMIELPLKYPQLFERLGIEPPKGVLLHGPPGCGKTLIARAVANETAAYFAHITGAEVMGKFYGESEARLRSVFEEAKANSPAILFIDEIDAIAPKREEMGGEKQVERRVVAQLLGLMDGLESRGDVIVIAATNIPNSLDPALRRPGRFDREIALSVPDQRARLEILQIHTRGMPLTEDIDLEKLSQITHGFVGADVKALCREAAMNALRRIMPEIDFQLNMLPNEPFLKLEVTIDDFREALKETEPSAIREVFVETPSVSWEDVGGLERVREKLVEAVEWPLKYPEMYEWTKTKPPKGILLSGRPGTGKTLLAKALASESEVNFISVKGPELISKYVGESERGVREVFRKARQASPCIVFFDEFDSLVPQRGVGGDSRVAERVISQFLTELDGLQELKGVLVLGATNRKDLIDLAILRPGRFDLVIELPVPDLQARQEIFKVHTQGKPLGPDVDSESLARETEGLVGSDIEAICREASMAAIREAILAGCKQQKLQIHKNHLNAAIEHARSGKGE
jgi:transitional endoplasmic reticulum ATPase